MSKINSIVIQDAEWGDVFVVKHYNINGNGGWYYGLFNQHEDISNVDGNPSFYSDDHINMNFKGVKTVDEISPLDVAKQILIDHRYSWQRSNSEKDFDEQWLNQTGEELPSFEQQEYLTKFDELISEKFLPNKMLMYINDPHSKNSKLELNTQLIVYDSNIILREEIQKGIHLKNDNTWIGEFRISDSLSFSIVTGNYDGNAIVDLRPTVNTSINNLFDIAGKGIINNEEVHVEYQDIDDPIVNLDSHWISYNMDELKELDSKQLKSKFLTDIQSKINGSKVLPSLACNYSDFNRTIEKGKLNQNGKSLVPAQINDIKVFFTKASNNDQQVSTELANEIIRITDEDDSSLYVDAEGRICMPVDENIKVFSTAEDLGIVLQRFFENQIENVNLKPDELQEEKKLLDELKNLTDIKKEPVRYGFNDDREKMDDFYTMEKDDFLKFYSYLTDDEYEQTKYIDEHSNEPVQRAGYVFSALVKNKVEKEKISIIKAAQITIQSFLKEGKKDLVDDLSEFLRQKGFQAGSNSESTEILSEIVYNPDLWYKNVPAEIQKILDMKDEQKSFHAPKTGSGMSSLSDE